MAARQQGPVSSASTHSFVIWSMAARPAADASQAANARRLLPAAIPLPEHLGGKELACRLHVEGDLGAERVE